MLEASTNHCVVGVDLYFIGEPPSYLFVGFCRERLPIEGRLASDVLIC